jgi:WD40 repeat protein
MLLLAIIVFSPHNLMLAQDASATDETPQPNEIVWNSDGTLIAVGTERAGIFIYDALDLASPPAQIFDGARVLSLAFVPNTPHQLAVSILSPNPEGCVAEDDHPKSGLFVYDLDAGEIALMISNLTGGCGIDVITQLQFNAGGSILTTNNSGQFVSYAFPTGESGLRVAPYDFGGFPMFDLTAISGDGSQLALAQTVDDDHSYLFRAAYSSGELVGFEDGRITRIVTALALSYDGNRIVIGDEIGSLRTYFRPEGAPNYSEYQEVIRAQRSTTSNRINAIAISPNGAIVTAESDPHAVVRVFELETLTEIMSFVGGETTTAALDLAFNPDGSRLAVLVDDTVRILATSDFSQLAELSLQQG